MPGYGSKLKLQGCFLEQPSNVSGNVGFLGKMHLYKYTEMFA